MEALSQKSRNETGTDSSADFSLWDQKRIQAYKTALIQKFDPPLAVLRIERIGLAVSVFEGVDDLTLDRGVGHIPDTGRIGGSGNIGIAGHRDGFFRGLKDISKGDNVQLVSAEATYNYTIDQILIVKPEDVWVLAPQKKASLTLVTCYPFYFVGHAPSRYIIQASLKAIEPKVSSKN